MFLTHLIIFLACERIEQLSQDYKEQPIKRPDPPRHRLSCKAQRKDYPAFNINLRVVQEFLARLGLEKAEHLITFQQPSEEYSPWKGVGVQVVKKVSNGDGPTTWAQAALTSLNNKLNMVNTADNSVGSFFSAGEGRYLVADSLQVH